MKKSVVKSMVAVAVLFGAFAPATSALAKPHIEMPQEVVLNLKGLKSSYKAGTQIEFGASMVTDVAGEYALTYSFSDVDSLQDVEVDSADMKNYRVDFGKHQIDTSNIPAGEYKVTFTVSINGSKAIKQTKKVEIEADKVVDADKENTDDLEISVKRGKGAGYEGEELYYTITAESEVDGDVKVSYETTNGQSGEGVNSVTTDSLKLERVKGNKNYKYATTMTVTAEDADGNKKVQEVLIYLNKSGKPVVSFKETSAAHKG